MAGIANGPGAPDAEAFSPAGERHAPEQIISSDRPCCILCNGPGAVLYRELRDELFGAPGSWGLRRCLDPDCGLIWLDPAPLASELPKAYRSYYTHLPSGATGRSEDTGWLRARVIGLYGHLVHYTGLLEGRRRLLLRHLDAMKPGRLIEIGCGDGSFLCAARSRGWQVTGVDSDPQAAQAAREKYGLTVLAGRFEDCDFPHGQFDLIVMNHVIEHVSDPVSLLRSCAALLQAGGRVLLVTPNSAGLGHAVFGRDWRGLEPPRHLHIFSPGALARAVRGSGLHPLRLGTTSVNAEAIFRGSTPLRGARGASPAGAPSLRLLMLSWLYQYYALLRQLWNSGGGEEIVMVCGKSAQVPEKE